MCGGKCGLWLPKSEFNIHSSRKDGLQKWCKACISEYNKKRYDSRKLVSQPVDCKECFVCGRMLAADCFHALPSHSSGLNSYCRDCFSIRKRAKKYGLTFQEVVCFLQIPECQNPHCRRPFDSESDMHFDHCHSVGRFRGVLCRDCNTAACGETDEALRKLRGLADYLMRGQESLERLGEFMYTKT